MNNIEKSIIFSHFIRNDIKSDYDKNDIIEFLNSNENILIDEI